MKIKHIDNSLLFENLLLEDKQVKFGGEVNPKYGWCVIYAGGSASGKSTMSEYNVPIVGKKVDVDEFKKLDFVKKFEGGKYYDQILNSPEIAGDEKKMTLKNANYTSLAHRETAGISNKAKDQQANVGKYNNPDRLPNIIFDQTTKDFGKLYNQVKTVKQYGYKVAIIWILTDMEKNYKKFHDRGKTGRKMDASLFMEIHPKVLETMLDIFNSREMLQMLDDFWVVVNNYKTIPAKKPRTEGGRKRKEKLTMNQIKATNVYHIPLEPDGLQNPIGVEDKDTIWNMITQNLQWFDRPDR